MEVLVQALQNCSQKQIEDVEQLKLERKITEEQEAQLLAEIESIMWRCYEDYSYEVYILSLELFPNNCIKDVRKATDYLGRTCWIFRTINI